MASLAVLMAVLWLANLDAGALADAFKLEKIELNDRVEKDADRAKTETYKYEGTLRECEARVESRSSITFICHGSESVADAAPVGSAELSAQIDFAIKHSKKENLLDSFKLWFTAKKPTNKPPDTMDAAYPAAGNPQASTNSNSDLSRGNRPFISGHRLSTNSNSDPSRGNGPFISGHRFKTNLEAALGGTAVAHSNPEDLLEEHTLLQRASGDGKSPKQPALPDSGPLQNQDAVLPQADMTPPAHNQVEFTVKTPHITSCRQGYLLSKYTVVMYLSNHPSNHYLDLQQNDWLLYLFLTSKQEAASFVKTACAPWFGHKFANLLHPSKPLF